MMSSTNDISKSVSTQGIGTIPLRQAIAAEFVRARHTAASRLVLLGLLICLVQALGWLLVSSRSLDEWDQLLGWQSVYITGLAAPFTALFVGLTTAREARARDGGTRWRPIEAATAGLARFTVLSCQLLGFNLAITLPLLGFGVLLGLDVTTQIVVRLVALPLSVWVGTLPVVALALPLSRRIGTWPVLGLAVVWQVLALLTVESPSWWFQPWTWHLRPSLPLLRVHANAVALEPDSPIRQWALWPPVLLALIGTAAVLAVSHALAGRRGWSRRPTRRPAATTVPSAVRPLIADRPGGQGGGTPRPTLALAGSLRRTAIGWLVPAAVLLLAGTALIWDADHVEGLFSLAILPVGCCLLACLAWTAQRAAWRVLATRAPATRLCRALFGCCLATLVVVLAAAALLLAVGGAGLPVIGRVLVLGLLLGAALLGINLWLVTQFGVGAAIGTTLLALVLSLVFGGSELATGQLWLLGPLAWAHSADTASRAVIAGAASGLVAVISVLGWARAARRVG